LKHIKLLCVMTLLVLTLPLKAAVSDDFINQSLLGDHDFTLQWLDNFNKGNKGEIEFVRIDGDIMVNGYHNELIGADFNYMDFTGKVTFISEREIRIEGDLLTKINHINNGAELRRSGEFIFKAHGKRQYWRLQNKREHEVMDYVDIHFKK